MKITIAVCITVFLCLAVGVGGFLSYYGNLDGQFFQLLTSCGVGIGLLANLARTEYVAQKTDKVDEQTNGANSRLQKIADTALAELPPEQARGVLNAVDTPDSDTNREDPHGPGYDPRRL